MKRCGGWTPAKILDPGSPMPWTETLHDSATTRDQALLDALRTTLDRALRERGQALIALAGGSTPLALYRALANQPLDFARITALPTDERCVLRSHPACNLGSLQHAFASAPALHWLPLTDIDGDPDARLANAGLARYPQDFDLVLLGIGADGHTASLFPGAAELPAALAANAPDALLIHPDPLPREAPFARISLSLQRLERSRRTLLSCAGDAKLAVLRQAQTECDPLRWPIAALLHGQGPTIEIHWSP